MNTNGSNKLLDIHTSHDEKVSDKWEIYLEEYDRLFAPFRNKSINLLEIGIQNGGSLEVWTKYFPEIEFVIGCDIDEKCLDLDYKNPAVKVIVGDATLETTKKSILNYTKEFDIIIEDGSHISNHIIRAFLDFFPLLKEDGLFIAEDLHCSYWMDWEGGLYFPYSSMSFFKLLADIINQEHWGVDKNITTFLDGFSKEYNLQIDEEIFSSIHSVEFVNSMCFIRKKQHKKNILGKRFIAGKVANVCNDPLEVKNTISNAPNQKNNFWSNIKQRPSENYLVLLKQIQEKDQQIQEKDQQIQHWHDVAQSLRIKNRIKKAFKKIIPSILWKVLRYIKHNPNAVKLGFHILKTQGFNSLLEKIKKVDNLSEERISNSYDYVEPELTHNIKVEINNFHYTPLISIIMPVYNVDPKWLSLAIKSIENQWYDNWELCIADDKSTNEKTINYLKSIENPKIKIIFLEKNLNISGASNAALELATGEYIALMDNDDEITPDALYEVVKVINEEDAEFIYSDEDFMTPKGKCVNPHFKPDFSPDLLLSHNYITHFTVFKKSLLEKVGTFNSDFDGAQDYDLFLRLTEITNKIYHIPKVLYHWRMIGTSTSFNSEAKPEALERGRKVLEAAIQRHETDAIVENANLHHYFRVKYKIIGSPLVSIIIPFKDKPELLTMCIESILEKSTYQNFEVIGISNNSSEQATFDEMKRLKTFDRRVRFYEYNVPFNYSQINNHAVNTYAQGEHILLLNNDIEIITPDWIESMLEHSQRTEIGCVGAKLYYPNDTIQHAGVIIGLGGYAAHSHKMCNRNDYGYFNRLNIVQNLSAVTGACLMVKKLIYQKMNGLDEEKFKIAYNDVDFCLRVREAGYLNIFTPFAEAYHYESISRGYEETVEKIARFEQEKKALYEHHPKIIDHGDPYYNPNLTLDREDFSLR